MGQGSFEDIVSKKFEGEGKEVPSRVWENVNSSLNADLVTQYESSHSWYRWLTAAAILIAVSSLTIHLAKEPAGSEEIVYSYNALLTNEFSSSQFPVRKIKANRSIFSWRPMTINDKVENKPFVDEQKSHRFDDLEIIEIKTKQPRLELAESKNQLNPYYRTLGVSVSKSLSKKNQFWAGLEAGAGKFSPNFSGANTISSSINSAAAATALGASDFNNPSANAVQNTMNEGTATSVGFDFGMKLGKKWTLESGFAYTNLNNSGSASLSVLGDFSNNVIPRTSNVDPESPMPSERERTTDIQVSANGDVDINSNIQFASMPLKAGYYLVDNRFSVRLNAGVAANYLIENSLNDPTKEIINGSESNLYNDWSFDGIGGLEFGYRLFDKIDMTIEPNYRYSITPLSNTINSPSRFVIQTGFRYTLR